MDAPGTVGFSLSDDGKANPLSAGLSPNAYRSSPRKSGRGTPVTCVLRLLTWPSVSTAAMR